MSLFIQNILQYYKNYRLKFYLVIAALIFIGLLALVRITLPYTVNYATISWLAKQGITAHIGDIDFDFLNGKLLVKNASGTDSNHHKFNINNINLSWHWTPLSKKVIAITGIAINNLNVDIQRYTDTIIIAGLNLEKLSNPDVTGMKENTAENKTDNKKTILWGLSIGGINLTNIKLCYQQYSSNFRTASAKNRQLDYCTSLDRLSWQGSLRYGNDKITIKSNKLPLTSMGDFELDGFSIEDKQLNRNLISGKQIQLKHVVINGLDNISVDTIILNNLSALQRADKKSAPGKAVDSVHLTKLNINKIKLKNLNQLKVNSITLKSPGLFIQKHKNNIWSYQQWLHLPPKNKIKSPQSTKTTSASKRDFTAEIGNIHILNSHFCYDDKTTINYYCLKQNSLNWKGKASFSTQEKILTLNGDLTINQTNVSNKNIQRQLFSLNELALKQLVVQSINNITIDKVSLINLHALQRSHKITDDTVWFDNLNMNSLKLIDINNLTIDTIKLTEPGLYLSKDVDGLWEFNKWLAENNIKPVKHANKPGTKRQLKTKVKPTARLHEIALNQLTVKTRQKIIYRDNSLKPVMHVGLKQLSLKVEHINSARPNQKTSFKLQATSIRRASINLAGYALPFKPKPSFNATGNLTGFDLRAISPAVKKAIGHIIKSGQMDAKLKLLATNGKLDSNIKLALYQFNLQAVSKKDASALDKKFGIPINQSLSLLRNRDGSIHLDIPITGHINNPDFDPTDAIIKATSKAATVTLITFFTPYGLVYAGGNVLFDLATAMRFEPVLFVPGTTVLSDKNRAQLDKLAKMLSKKPQLHLTLCATSNQSDRNKLFAASATEDGTGINKRANRQKKKNGSPLKSVLTKKQREKLKMLAAQRQQNTKSYLVDKAKIGADRLILCVPKYSSNNDAIAGVDINI